MNHLTKPATRWIDLGLETTRSERGVQNLERNLGIDRSRCFNLLLTLHILWLARTLHKWSSSLAVGTDLCLSDVSRQYNGIFTTVSDETFETSIYFSSLQSFTKWSSWWRKHCISKFGTIVVLPKAQNLSRQSLCQGTILQIVLSYLWTARNCAFLHSPNEIPRLMTGM